MRRLLVEGSKQIIDISLWSIDANIEYRPILLPISQKIHLFFFLPQNFNNLS